MSTTAPACAAISWELAESPAATASTARTWLLLEQPGPWGAKAFTSSHLDPAVGRALEQATKGTGIRAALIRRPGRHADSHDTARPRRVFLAHTVPGAGWLRTATVDDPAHLLDLDFSRIGDGHHDGFGTDHTGDPLALVCTNGRRDRCCALLGRPLAAELAEAGHGDVWETTHLGGHRFAPTMLVLPHGYAYARQDTASAKSILLAAADGRVITHDCRGRSAWPPAGQAAELAVRALTAEDHADALTVLSDDAVLQGAGTVLSEGLAVQGARTVRVAHQDGRRWTVTVAPQPPGAAPARPQSCGANPVEPSTPHVLSVTEDGVDGGGPQGR